MSFAYVVDARERIDEVMAQAKGAGATILKPTRTADWGAYLGCFSDADGNFWKVVVGQTG